MAINLTNKKSSIRAKDASLIRAQDELLLQQKKKCKKKIMIIGTIIVIFIISIIILVKAVIIPTKKYNTAINLIRDGQNAEACEIFADLGHFKDSKAQLEKISKNIIKSANAGDFVYFGDYEQDNKISKWQELIAWQDGSDQN